MRPSIAIVGGGFTGCAAALQLARASAAPLDIVIVEPRAELGRGVAYGSDDPDHRLNGSAGTHFLDPDDTDALTRWCEATRLLERDPAALAPNGQLYIRRGDFGRFVGETLEAQRIAPNGSTIGHLRDRVVDARARADAIEIVTARGERRAVQLLVIATGYGGPRLPHAFEAHAAHPALIADASEMARVRAIPPSARVLLVGAGLTALDIASTLVRRGHEGPITAISRHGLRPRPQRPPDPEATCARFLRRLDEPVPDFIALAPRTARGLAHALRARIRDAERMGIGWYVPFDEVRDRVWKIWPLIDTAEKKRFLKWLRPWYDVHRFRTPPQNDALVGAAEARGAIDYRRGALIDVRAEGAALHVTWTHAASGAAVTQRFNAVVNCTGLDATCGARDNPLLASLVAQGLARPDPTGFGYEVDRECRPVNAHGTAQRRLRIFGPPSAGTMGDPLGVLFIAPQVRRAIAGMLSELAPARLHQDA